MKQTRPFRLSIAAVFVLLLLTAIVPSACRQNSANESETDSTTVAPDDSAYWDNVAFQLNIKASDYYNQGEKDSLEAFVPEAMQTCLEHGLVYRYYCIWELLAEGYVWTNEFDKAVAEAQRIEEDATQRKDEFGLFTAYNVLGIGHAYIGNHQEAVKYLRKAISHFHSDLIAPVCKSYNYLTQTLNDAKQYEELDSALAEWKALIEKYEPITSKNATALFLFQYSCTLVSSLIEQEKYDAAEAAADSLDAYLIASGNPLLSQTQALQIKTELAYARHDYSTALRYAQKLRKTAEECGDNSKVISSLQVTEMALEGTGRYQHALEIRRELDAFKDSLAEVDNREQLNELNKRFEVNELKMQAERDKIQLERDKMQAERRQLYLVLAIILLAVVGGALFAYYRYRQARRMAQMRAAQERIEGELRIARDIQMSMVPSTFPDREGLDMYASMTPAKEVGGDLYGYVLQDDKLYFAVGDVSGKGVPASAGHDACRDMHSHERRPLWRRQRERHVRHLLPRTDRPDDGPPQLLQRGP